MTWPAMVGRDRHAVLTSIMHARLTFLDLEVVVLAGSPCRVLRSYHTVHMALPTAAVLLV